MLQTQAVPETFTEHSHGEARTAVDFSREEFEALRMQDRHAARIISSLLAGVFILGLAMYTYIWWVVAN